MRISQVALLLCIVLAVVEALDNGLANVPPLGWSTWNFFWCNVDCDAQPDICVSEKNIKEMADAMVTSGLNKLGYQFVNVDDCYLAKDRDIQTQKLIPNPVNFPNGMKSLGDYIHSKGLKYGMYNDVGTKTCGGYPGSKDHYLLDIATFKEWGVDYLKTDGCYEQQSIYHQDYTELRNQIDEQKANIIYECSWPAYIMKADEFDWAYLRSICNTWRTYGDDIRDSWDSVKAIIQYWSTEDIAKFSGPGSFHMADFLTPGQGGMNNEEYKTQFSLWSMWSSPIMLSTDLRKMNADTFTIISNQEVIQNVSQDPLVKQATRVQIMNDIDIWVKQLAKPHSYAIAFVNMSDTLNSSVTVAFSDILENVQSQVFNVRDLWLHKDLDQGVLKFNSVILSPHSTQLIKVDLSKTSNLRMEIF